MPNYRQQTATSLGSTTACPSCAPIYSSLSLCFSSVSADALCCGNSTSVTVYVAGTGVTTLASVTGLLYTTTALNVEAAVGFYSDDLSGGCNPPDGEIINTPDYVTYVLQNGNGQDSTYSFINTDGVRDNNGFLSNYEEQTICALKDSVQMDANIYISSESPGCN